jgi:anthranilate phosphoribosyltransferase
VTSAFLRKFLASRWEPSGEEFHEYLEYLLSRPLSPTIGKETVALLAALSARPLSAPCVTHFVSYVRSRCPPMPLAGARQAVNIVGTGGGVATFNISTAAALVARAAGAVVLKSGSRAFSSESGALNVLHELGIATPREASGLELMIQELGISFVSEAHSAPVLRRLVANVQPLSWRDIGGFVNTVGPLLLPYDCAGQLVGVARHDQFDTLAEAVRALATRPTLLVHSYVGMDELCSFADNRAAWVHEQPVSLTVPLEKLRFGRGELHDLAGGPPAQSAARIRGVLSGRVHGAARETVALNAGVLLLVAEIASSIEDGVERARSSIEDGSAARILERVQRWSQSHAPVRSEPIERTAS